MKKFILGMIAICLGICTLAFAGCSESDGKTEEEQFAEATESFGNYTVEVQMKYSRGGSADKYVLMIDGTKGKLTYESEGGTADNNDEYFSEEVLNSNFWLYWRTMFAFENWHSALEMKLYMKRYIHHIGGLPDFTALRFTKYNQYESMILPMVRYLQGFGVQFHYGVKVVNVEFDIQKGQKTARRVDIIREEKEEAIDLTENDLVFITN